MNRPLRRRHLAVWIALALLLPAILVAAIGTRHRDPVNETVPTRVGETRQTQK